MAERGAYVEPARKEKRPDSKISGGPESTRQRAASFLHWPEWDCTMQ
jgi:hypothetical protein